MPLNHQDFVTVNVGYGHKPPPKSNVTNKVGVFNGTSEQSEEKKTKYVGGVLANAIIQARNAKKMTQKELANKTSMKQNEIAQIETGKSIYGGEIINKINKIQRILGSKLPRP